MLTLSLEPQFYVIIVLGIFSAGLVVGHVITRRSKKTLTEKSAELFARQEVADYYKANPQFLKESTQEQRDFLIEHTIAKYLIEFSQKYNVSILTMKPIRENRRKRMFKTHK